jgi:uncharacterized protein (DUF1810 family)
MMTTPFGLSRFLTAQSGCYQTALHELKQGQKQSHWMWYIFPQIEGLGHSELALKFALESLEEAEAYLVHPVLGERLIECTNAVLSIQNRTALDIFGRPDNLKFHSCMTLFAEITADKSIFNCTLERYFTEKDRLTLELI